MSKYLLVLASVLFTTSVTAHSVRWTAFFELDSAQLSANAISVVGDIVERNAAQCVLRVESVGHIDGAEALKDGSALDIERAYAVAAQFRREGLNRLEIVIRPMRFTLPLVQTA